MTTQDTRFDASREIRAPRGSTLTCKSWPIEAAYRMLQNNLDPEVAENPNELVVYGGIGKAARNWPAFEAILDSLRKLKPNETLMVQSGKPVGVFRTHEGAPRVRGGRGSEGSRLLQQHGAGAPSAAGGGCGAI